MEMECRLVFKEFYKEEMKEPIEYLGDINKVWLIQRISYFLTGACNKIEDFFCEQISGFFTPPNLSDARLLKRYVESRQKPTCIISNYASLYVLEAALSLPDDCNSDESTYNPKWEIQILKAYLSANHKIVSREDQLSDQIKKLNESEQFAAYQLCIPLSYYDYEKYDNRMLMAQITKAVHFFKFLEEDKRYAQHLRLFCEKYNCKSWEDYMHRYIQLPIDKLLEEIKSGKKLGHTEIKLRENDTYFNERSAFLDEFSINNHISQHQHIDDFLQLRNFPLYKKDKTTYIVLFEIFLVERIYKSLYFEFNKIDGSIEEVNRSDFRGMIAYNFSERYLAYKLLDGIFDKKNFIAITGSDFKKDDKKVKGEPDYYARSHDGKTIFLFESKDILLNAKTKVSQDCNKILATLKKKLCDDVGIEQLKTNITKVLKKTLPRDTDYEARDVNIYPILLLHDRIYSVSGLNFFLNRWYSEAIDQVRKTTEVPERIKPLTVIDIDTLILLQDLEHGKNYKLKTLIDDYIAATNNYESCKYISFKDYAEPIIKARIRHLPSDHVFYAMKIISSIFPESFSSESRRNIWS
jgi:hypothetical protein